MSDFRPTVTVVIPTHNRRQLLFRTLDSVLRQRNVPLEVVVVDDGGSDGTTEAVRDRRIDGVRVIRHERSRGVSGARNAGLAAASTPWVAFVDDDDLWAPDKIAAQLKALAERSHARWSCVGAARVNTALRLISYAESPVSGDVSPALLGRNVIPGGGSGVLVATDLARDISGYDEQLSTLADWDFYLRLSLRSELAAVQQTLLAYYIHSDSMIHDPGRVVRELFALEAKHSDLGDGRRLHFDRSYWFLILTRMAHRLGDDRTAARLLARGVRQGAAVDMLRQVAPGVGRRAWRTLRRSGPPEPVPPPNGLDFETSVGWWLARYANADEIGTDGQEPELRPSMSDIQAPAVRRVEQPRGG